MTTVAQVSSRYVEEFVELNPVRAGLVNSPRQYRFSSAAAHQRGADDALVRVRPLLQLAPDWRRFLRGYPVSSDFRKLLLCQEVRRISRQQDMPPCVRPIRPI